MSPKIVRALTYLLTSLGLTLMLVGGTMWWRQSRVEAALMGHEERVLLAINAASQPATLPDFERYEQPKARPTPSGEPPAPTRTTPPPAPTRAEAEAAPSAPPSPTPDPFPPASVAPSRIVAPAIGLDAAVVQMGWEVKQDANGNAYSEWLVPDYAAGWHQNSALPGHGTNTVLSAHHNIAGEVFRYIVNLEPGNEVMVEAGGIPYRYVVEEKYIVREKGESLEARQANNRYIEATADERLTLVSCWPYETNSHRVIVIARPVVPPPPSPSLPEVPKLAPQADAGME